jgi:hypothetical protein
MDAKEVYTTLVKAGRVREAVQIRCEGGRIHEWDGMGSALEVGAPKTLETIEKNEKAVDEVASNPGQPLQLAETT